MTSQRGSLHGDSAADSGSLPADVRVDRRRFLKRLGALGAAASSGALAPVWSAAPAGAVSPLPRVPSLAAMTAREVAWPQETDPADLTLVDAAALLRAGQLSPVELVEACLARIRSLDSRVLAFNAVLEEAALEGARAAARALDAGGTAMTNGTGTPGPLTGLPLAMKDNFFTAGVATTANSHIFRDFVPGWDAEAWRRLRAAGAVLVGKTQMGPLATSRATTPDGEATTRNAWAPDDPDISPGGSSSGSATAVALGMASCATGTQTGGSITNPADAQGLTGLKPTMGRVSLRGIIPLTYTRDHPGPLARDARDAALLLQVMAGTDPADPRTLDQPPVPDLLQAATPVTGAVGQPALRWPTRIGVLPDYLDERGDPPADPGPEASDEVRLEYRLEREEWDRRQAGPRARRAMLDTFRELGAEIVEVPYPDDWETLTGRHFNNVRLPERSEPFLPYLREDVRQFGASLSPWINGLLLPGAEYLRGQRARLLLLRRTLDTVFSRCDVVVQSSPIPFDILGLPLISFPIGTRRVARGGGRAGSDAASRSAGPPRGAEHGGFPAAGVEPAGEMELPEGALLGGLPWAEDRLLSLAAAWQAVTDWHRRRPPVLAELARREAPVPGGDGEGSSPRLDVLDVWIQGQ